MRKISVINEKGGVGKTTVCVNLASGLAKKGKKILLVDLDPQGNSSQYFLPEFKKVDIKKFNQMEINENLDIRKALEIIDDFIRQEGTNKKDINNLLIDGKEVINECIYNTEVENLRIIPSLDTNLIKTDKYLTATPTRVYNRLKKALREVRNDYDYVLFDHAPTFNNITINGLFCSDEIIIPLKVGGSELRSFVSMMKEIFEFEDEFEQEYEIKMLMNMIPRGNRPDYYNFINKMREFFPKNVLLTTIGYQDAVVSRSSMTSTVLLESNTKVGADYNQLVEEILLEDGE